MFYYYVTKVLPVEGDELHVGDTYPKEGLPDFNPATGEVMPSPGEILSIMAIVEPTEDGSTEEFDLVITRHNEDTERSNNTPDGFVTTRRTRRNINDLIVTRTKEKDTDPVHKSQIDEALMSQPDDPDMVRLNSDPSKVVTKKSLADAARNAAFTMMPVVKDLV